MKIPTKYASKKNIVRCAAALAVGGCVGAVSFSAALPAAAQDQAASGVAKKVSLNLVNQPVQTAVRLLFSSVGLNNSIDQDVQGYVTIDVTSVSFDVALRSLLRAANPPLTYDVENGVYHISVKRDTQAAVNSGPGTGPAVTTTTALPEGIHAYRIPIDHYDASIIAQLIAAQGKIVIVPPNDLGSSGTGTGGTQGGGGRGGGGGGFGGGGGGGFGGGGGSTGGGFGGGGGGFGGGGGGFGGGGSTGGGGFGGF